MSQYFLVFEDTENGVEYKEVITGNPNSDAAKTGKLAGELISKAINRAKSPAYRLLSKSLGK